MYNLLASKRIPKGSNNDSCCVQLSQLTTKYLQSSHSKLQYRITDHRHQRLPRYVGMTGRRIYILYINLQKTYTAHEWSIPGVGNKGVHCPHAGHLGGLISCPTDVCCRPHLAEPPAWILFLTWAQSPPATRTSTAAPANVSGPYWIDL